MPAKQINGSLPYKTPIELWSAYAKRSNSTNFILHYHGEKEIVTAMRPSKNTVHVITKSIFMPVAIFPDGSSGEGQFSRERNSIWLDIEEGDEPISLSTLFIEENELYDY
jgi:hypothetical protein